MDGISIRGGHARPSLLLRASTLSLNWNQTGAQNGAFMAHYLELSLSEEKVLKRRDIIQYATMRHSTKRSRGFSS